MGLLAGSVFSLGARNAPIAGCTTSESLYRADAFVVSTFSLAPRTDISAESYAYHKLLMGLAGQVQVYLQARCGWQLDEGATLVTPKDAPVGVRSSNGGVYLEISMTEEASMNEALAAGEVVRLADLLPYREGRVVNMDLAHNEGFKLALMSFDAGTGLDEHAAPGEALVFALDGEGIIGYEGSEHVIHVGENFKFDRGGRHYVRADRPFKMALLLTLH